MNTVWFPGANPPMLFTAPREVVSEDNLDGIPRALEQIDAWCARGGWAAGFLAYEAAPAFEPALYAHPPMNGLPLLWFGLYGAPSAEAPRTNRAATHPASWEAGITEHGYRDAIARIREHIAAGDSYQVNYTFPMTARLSGDPLAWFCGLYESQRTQWAAYIDADRFLVLSASPELFFELDGERLVTRPMKGTRPRGRWAEDDARQALELRDSAKECAENVMIVDLLRNDLGRIAAPGTVNVDCLYEIERYDTVWQMTSTISCRTHARMPDIIGALFPCGSVTGAPKIMTTRIIRELETQPRGVYCGAVGWWGPNRRAAFNVAIRTVLVDTQANTARYYVGSGVTWDSAAEAEFRECLDKAAILQTPDRDFDLLETLLWDGDFFLLDAHIRRLAASAAYFGIPFNRDSILDALQRAISNATSPLRVRLLLDHTGASCVEKQPVPAPKTFRLGFASAPIDAADRFLYHKTTRRDVYEKARASRPDCDDVLLWNERGEITESSIANVVVEIAGRKLTPPLECGLLPGVMRAHLLECGEIAEERLTKEDVDRASAIWLINSVRKWIPVAWEGERSI